MRPHTGRRRNEETRRAVLDAALGEVREGNAGRLTMEGLARRAGASKQTLYRWWPAPAAILLEAALEQAQRDVPTHHTDDPYADLETFLTSTYTAAGAPDVAPVLAALAAEAQRDPDIRTAFQEFTATRRAELRALVERLDRADDSDLFVDVVYGVLWYRLLTGHGPLDARLAHEITTRMLPHRAD